MFDLCAHPDASILTAININSLSESEREFGVAPPRTRDLDYADGVKLNTVQILGRGRELGTEDLKKLIERVDREKQAMARERLAGPDGDQPGANK
jgi:hypothetical protein